MQRCITGLKLIGLKANPKKTEIINVVLAVGKFSCVVNSFNDLLQEVKMTEITKMELLGYPILNDATRCCIVRKLTEYTRMIDRIVLLDDHPELLAEYDEVTRSTTEALCNIHFDDNSWSQA